MEPIEVYEQLERYLTKDAIDMARSGKVVSLWDWSSYPIIVKQFENLAGKHTEKAWVKRIAYTFSWIQRVPQSTTPKIPNGNFIKLEKKFQQAKLKKIKFAEMDGEKQISYKTNQHLINEFLSPVSSMLYTTDNIDTQLPTLTKLLHFMFPNLFPFFDRNVCERVFGSSYTSSSRYFSYMEGIKLYLNNGTQAAYLVKKAEKMQLSPLFFIHIAVAADNKRNEQPLEERNNVVEA